MNALDEREREILDYSNKLMNWLLLTIWKNLYENLATKIPHF